MGTSDTLGILVHSNQYFEYVFNLAAAAKGKGKNVCIHLTGAGLELMDSSQLAHLSRLARISISEAPEQTDNTNELLRLPGAIEIVPDGQLDLVLNDWDRCVVF